VSEPWKRSLSAIEENPQRTDLVAGFVSLCRIIKNPVEQASALVACSKVILAYQPLLALKILQLSLGLMPRHPGALVFAKEIFKRRGRWASEQRVAELIATLTHTMATTFLAPEISASVAVVATKAETVASDPELETGPQRADSLHGVQQEAWRNFADERVLQFLNRCGFELEWASFANGFSKNNAGLVAFASMLASLSMLKSHDLPLAVSMLKKMIQERPDDSGAEQLLERLFPDSISTQREGK
jgi:hypothetical protein